MHEYVGEQMGWVSAPCSISSRFGRMSKKMPHEAQACTTGLAQSGPVASTWAVNREMHFPFGRVLQIQSLGAYLRQAGMARSFATRFVERFAFS